MLQTIASGSYHYIDTLWMYAYLFLKNRLVCLTWNGLVLNCWWKCVRVHALLSVAWCVRCCWCGVFCFFLTAPRQWLLEGLWIRKEGDERDWAEIKSLIILLKLKINQRLVLVFVCQSSRTPWLGVHTQSSQNDSFKLGSDHERGQQHRWRQRVDHAFLL